MSCAAASHSLQGVLMSAIFIFTTYVSVPVPACSPQCGLGNASDSILAEVKKTFLTSSSVKSDGGAPVFVSSGRRYSRVAAMRTRAADSKQHTVLFLLTGETEAEPSAVSVCRSQLLVNLQPGVKHVKQQQDEFLLSAYHLSL